MTPLVSIILPCYNRASYLEKCVKSVLAQTYTNLECILVDDGSTDNTREVAERLMAADERVQYFYKENGGVSTARNFGIEKALGEWIQCLDPDDWIHEDKTRFQLSCLEGLENQNVVLYCDYERVFLDSNQNIIRREQNIIGSLNREELKQRLLLPDFLAKSPFPVLQQCMLIKKEVLQAASFDSRLKALQDRDFALSLLTLGIDYIYTPIVGTFYTKHETNRTNNWEYMKNYYVLLYEIEASKSDELRNYSQPGIKFLLEQTLIEKDKNNFFKLGKIVNYPVQLFNGKFKVNSRFSLFIAYLLRIVLPQSLLYENLRGARSQKIINFISTKIWRFGKLSPDKSQ